MSTNFFPQRKKYQSVGDDNTSTWWVIQCIGYCICECYCLLPSLLPPIAEIRNLGAAWDDHRLIRF